MSQTIPLEYGMYYHIYNCGINGTSIFREESNFRHFLNLYDKYLTPFVDTYSWCLMRNHFHLLVRIKDEVEIDFLNGHNSDMVQNSVRVNPLKPHIWFSHLFNAYSQAFNKKYNRHGALFERAFKRKKIENMDYFRNLIVYIHDNPIHHGFVEKLDDYVWSSYRTFISNKSTKLKKDYVLNLFDNVENFKFVHKQKINIIEIEKFLL